MRDATVAAVEGITGLKVRFGRYLPDDLLRELSDSELGALLDVWRASRPGIGLKKCVANMNMGLPLLNEVERRWRESLESEDA